MKLDGFERVLVLAPHTDDAELGLGATIAKLVDCKNIEIHCHAFSNASKSLPKNSPKNTLEVEYRQAMDILGVNPDHVFIHNYEVRTFSYHRQQILDEIYKIRQDYNPDLIFLPSTKDLHQDHEVISSEGIRCFKTSCILGYELPWNNINFPTNCFIELEEKHIQKKIDALKCYKSQNYRSYLDAEFIKSLAITRGVQIQIKYAEAFELIRWVLS